MSSPVQKAVSAAFKLFSRQNHKTITRDNLKEIISHLNQVTKSELKLNPALLVDSVPNAEEPPVTYVRILENKVGLPHCNNCIVHVVYVSYFVFAQF